MCSALTICKWFLHHLRKTLFLLAIIRLSNVPGLGINNEDVANISHSATKNRDSIKPIYEFFESDNVGVIHARRCGNCKNCRYCSFKVHSFSLKEQYASQVIESKISYSKDQEQFVV